MAAARTVRARVRRPARARAHERDGIPGAGDSRQAGAAGGAAGEARRKDAHAEAGSGGSGAPTRHGPEGRRVGDRVDRNAPAVVDAHRRASRALPGGSRGRRHHRRAVETLRTGGVARDLREACEDDRPRRLGGGFDVEGAVGPGARDRTGERSDSTQYGRCLQHPPALAGPASAGPRRRRRGRCARQAHSGPHRWARAGLVHARSAGTLAAAGHADPTLEGSPRGMGQRLHDADPAGRGPPKAVGTLPRLSGNRARPLAAAGPAARRRAAACCRPERRGVWPRPSPRRRRRARRTLSA